MPVPKYDDLFTPLLKAMHDLGGSASLAEQEDRVASNLGLSDKDVAEIHRGSTTKLHYRLAWARTYLTPLSCDLPVQTLQRFCRTRCDS